MYLLESINSKSDKFFQYIPKNLFPEEVMKFVFHQVSEMMHACLWVYNAETCNTYSPENKLFRDISVLISMLPDWSCCSRVPNLTDSRDSVVKTSTSSDNKPEDWTNLIFSEMKAQKDGDEK